MRAPESTILLLASILLLGCFLLLGGLVLVLLGGLLLTSIFLLRRSSTPPRPTSPPPRSPLSTRRLGRGHRSRALYRRLQPSPLPTPVLKGPVLTAATKRLADSEVGSGVGSAGTGSSSSPRPSTRSQRRRLMDNFPSAGASVPATTAPPPLAPTSGGGIGTITMTFSGNQMHSEMVVHGDMNLTKKFYGHEDSEGEHDDAR